MDPPHQVGILFVHGVGEQRRGQVLTSFGDPLIRTIGAWLDDRHRGEVKPIKGVLSPAPGGFEPAHAVISIEYRGETEEQRATTRWLLAESWWAGDFENPPFARLAGWLLTTGAWAILMHAARPAFQRPRTRRRIAVAVARTLLAIPLAWLLQIAVILVSLLAWVPFPKFRHFLSNLLLRLSGTLGDSYVFLESPVQRAAAVETTRRSLEWVAEQGAPVIILAHSQGARIAYEALKIVQTQDPGTADKVKLFVTFGSAISKLTELEARARTEAARFVRVALLFALYCIVTFPRALQTAHESDALLWTMYAAAPVMMLAAAVVEAWRASKKAVDDSASATLKPIEWLDFYSSKDPVPNGPLRESEPASLFTSVEVANRGSVVSDHTSYWDNRDEFVLGLLHEIDRVAGTNVVRAGEVDRGAVCVSRRRRVATLSMVRLASFTGLPVLGYGLRDLLSGFGAGLLAAMAANPLTETIARAIAGAGALLVTPLVVVGKLDQETVASLGPALVSTAILVLIVWIWYTFCAAVAWATWDRQQFERLCRPGRDEALLERYGPVLMVLFVALIPSLVGLAAILFPQRASDLLRNVFDLVVLAYPLAFLCLMLAMVAGFLWAVLQLLIRAFLWLLSASRRRTGGGG
jgi:hypothetical protein